MRRVYPSGISQPVLLHSSTRSAVLSRRRSKDRREKTKRNIDRSVFLLQQRSQAIIESILLNSGDLFRLNIRGINVLIPLYLEALEYYLHIDCQSYLNAHFGQLKGGTAANASIFRDRFTQIRAKSIQILISIISSKIIWRNPTTFKRRRSRRSPSSAGECFLC